MKVIREMFMPQPSPTSHHHFMLSSSFLLPACISAATYNTMWLYSGSSYCCAPDQRDVYARAPGWPTLLPTLPTLPTIQPPYSATSPPGCWSSFTSSFQTVSTAVIVTQSGHLQMHKLREHEKTHFTSLAKRTLDLDVILLFFTLNGRIVAGFSCRI